MKWCDNKECEDYDVDEDNHCSVAATIIRCVKAMPLTTEKDTGAEVTLDCGVSLPDYRDCSEAVKEGRASALEQFICDQEPAGFSGDIFRQQLLDVLKEVAG